MIQPLTITWATVSPGQWSWAIGTLLIMAVAAIVLIKILRKWVKNGVGDTSAGDFSLDDLRKMRDAKQISEQEYKILRDKLLTKDK